MLFKTLNNGIKIPMLGYGVFEIPDAECEECVLQALECGYRHIDTAQIYGNEAGVGRAVEACNLPRSELFVTSKVWVKQYGEGKTLKSIEDSLKKLKTDYIDLMLLHRPFFDYIGGWKDLEKAYENGIVKAIGISNFNIKQTSEILGIANIPPAVNQIELHPYFGQIKLKDYLAKNGMEVEAWYPLGHGNKKLLGDPLITKLAAKYSKTPSQIILRWHIHCGNIVFPKTRSALHMRENLEIFSFGLSAEDIAAVSSLDKNKPLFSVPDWVQKLALRFSK